MERETEKDREWKRLKGRYSEGEREREKER